MIAFYNTTSNDHEVDDNSKGLDFHEGNVQTLDYFPG